MVYYRVAEPLSELGQLPKNRLIAGLYVIRISLESADACIIAIVV